jgi:hypothetical protein
MFVPLSHPAGHAQADFGEALVEIGGVEQKAHFFAFDLPCQRRSKNLPVWRSKSRPVGVTAFMAFFCGVDRLT